MIMPISPIWPAATAVNANGAIAFHGRTAESLLDEFGSPLYLIDADEVSARAKHFVRAAAEAFNTSTTHVSFAGKAFLSKEIVRLVAEAGMFVDTCTMGEMRIALAAGVPGRRLVLHGNNKSDDEIALAIEQGFAKIVVDEPNEPERIAAIARKLGKRARVMLRVTVGVHAGGHEYISTAHEDQKFGVPLLAAGADAAVLDVLNNLTDVTPAATNARIGESHERELHYDVKYPYDLSHEEVSDTDKALAAAMEAIADGPSIAVLKTILANQDVLELVGAHSHIGSNIHDADAFIHAAKRMMLLRKTLWATDAYIRLGQRHQSCSGHARSGHQLRARPLHRGSSRRDPVSCRHHQACAPERCQRQCRQPDWRACVCVCGWRHVRQYPSGTVRSRLHRTFGQPNRLY